MFKGPKRNACREAVEFYSQEGMAEKRQWQDAVKRYLEAGRHKSFTLAKAAQNDRELLEWSSCDKQQTHVVKGQILVLVTKKSLDKNAKQHHSPTSHK